MSHDWVPLRALWVGNCVTQISCRQPRQIGNIQSWSKTRMQPTNAGDMTSEHENLTNWGFLWGMIDESPSAQRCLLTKVSTRQIQAVRIAWQFKGSILGLSINLKIRSQKVALHWILEGLVLAGLSLDFSGFVFSSFLGPNYGAFGCVLRMGCLFTEGYLSWSRQWGYWARPLSQTNRSTA